MRHEPSAPFGVSKATLSGLPDADVPLDFVKEIKEIKGITQGPRPGFTRALLGKIDLLDKLVGDQEL